MALHPAHALQHALISALRADASLRALLGGERVYDALPARLVHPYLAYGPTSVRDWSTGSGSGHQHLVTITAVSREPGFRQVYALVDVLVAAVERATLTLDDHRLVLIRFETSEFRRDGDGLTSRGAATLRALTEPQL
jgi:hypothetical protein